MDLHDDEMRPPFYAADSARSCDREIHARTILQGEKQTLAHLHYGDTEAIERMGLGRSLVPPILYPKRAFFCGPD
jgi:hypothetical protein